MSDNLPVQFLVRLNMGMVSRVFRLAGEGELRSNHLLFIWIYIRRARRRLLAQDVPIEKTPDEILGMILLDKMKRKHFIGKWKYWASNKG